MKRRIYVPQLDTIYESIADAASALGVNSANISKVLKGSRRSAGGYNFISAVTAEGKRRTKQSLRKAARELIPDPLASERADLKRAIQAVNKQIKRVRGSGWGAFAGAIEDLLQLGDVFGRTKAGYLKANDALLYQLNEAEIIKYMEAIEERKKRRTYTITGAMKEAERIAGTFWTTSSRIAELADTLPLIFAMMHNEIEELGISSDQIREAAAEVFANPDAKPIDMVKALSRFNERIDTAAALEELLQNDFFMLDKFAPIRPQLEQLLEASKDPDFAGSEELENTIQSVSSMIMDHWADDSVDDLIDILKDDIEGTLHYYDIPIGGYDEEDEF